MNLPQEFIERMEGMLGEEAKDFFASYNNRRNYGLRVNTMKVSPEDFQKHAPFAVTPIPFVKNGFYYEEGTFPTRHPWYKAGVYYMQEPSAMTPASRLPIEKGDRVLDLCAAPGGKATELAAKLKGTGVLVANDLSNSRAKALLHNLELFGASNIFVTNEPPEHLEHVFEGFFDKILVDAPCSGEGMFRKDPDVIKTWSPKRVAFFAAQQKAITESAVTMLRPGGFLLYSTCTFSPEENEQRINALLSQYDDLEIVPLEMYEGFSEGNPEWADGEEELRKCVRIWPHKMDGEGHFLALLHKKDALGYRKEMPKKSKKERKKGEVLFSKDEKKTLLDFFQEFQVSYGFERLENRNGKVYLVPELPKDVKGIHFLRNGLFMGELKKNRFEPSQPLAMALSGENAMPSISLSAEDPRVIQYLNGEPITINPDEAQKNGWKVLAVDHFPLGFGKLVGNTLKNKYPASWR